MLKSVSFLMTRPMEHAAAGIDKVVAGALRRASPQDAPVLAWPVACGPAVAERTRALDCRDGILRVQVQDASWRNELQALAPRLLGAINRYATVKRIEFVVPTPSK